MNYLAVAKVGILTFADYIHDIYIADGGWKEDTWNWIFDPGYTLVDLVDAALGAIGSAISMIKAGVTAFVNGIKEAGQYLLREALELILTGVEGFISLLVHAIKEMINVFEPGSAVISNNILNYEDKKFGFVVNELDIQLFLADKEITI